MLVLAAEITATPASAIPWPVISHNVPAFASSGYFPASYANDEPHGGPMAPLHG